jgi:hypothetical protein
MNKSLLNIGIILLYLLNGVYSDEVLSTSGNSTCGNYVCEKHALCVESHGEQFCECKSDHYGNGVHCCGESISFILSYLTINKKISFYLNLRTSSHVVCLNILLNLRLKIIFQFHII